VPPSCTSRPAYRSSIFGACARMSSKCISSFQFSRPWRPGRMAGTIFLYQDYRPQLHISYPAGRGPQAPAYYSWIFADPGDRYIGKLLIHPAPVASLAGVLTRAAMGRFPVNGPSGRTGIHAAWIMIAIATYRGAGRRARRRRIERTGCSILHEDRGKFRSQVVDRRVSGLVHHPEGRRLPVHKNQRGHAPMKSRFLPIVP